MSISQITITSAAYSELATSSESERYVIVEVPLGIEWRTGETQPDNDAIGFSLSAGQPWRIPVPSGEKLWGRSRVGSVSVTVSA